MSFLLSFLILFGFWILLSGHFDFFYLGLGVICSLLVTWLSHDLLIGEASSKSLLIRAARLIAYLPWLLYQIAVANLDVAYRVLHPGMPIEPELLEVDADLKSAYGKITLAHSITLTPGTVTIDIRKGQYVVHTLSRKSADGLLRGVLQARVKRLEA